MASLVRTEFRFTDYSEASIAHLIQYGFTDQTSWLAILFKEPTRSVSSWRCQQMFLGNPELPHLHLHTSFAFFPPNVQILCTLTPFHPTGLYSQRSEIPPPPFFLQRFQTKKAKCCEPNEKQEVCQDCKDGNNFHMCANVWLRACVCVCERESLYIWNITRQTTLWIQHLLIIKQGSSMKTSSCNLLTSIDRTTTKKSQ